MRRVSIEPKENLTFHTTPYQPLAKLALVVASPAINGNIRGRGKENAIWMHLTCIENCISFLNNSLCRSNSTTKVDYTIASSAHRVHHEERGDLNAAKSFRLDASSIEIINQWQSDREREELSVLFEVFDILEAQANEEVIHHYLVHSYSLQFQDISQGNGLSGGNLGCRRRYPRYRQDVCYTCESCLAS